MTPQAPSQIASSLTHDEKAYAFDLASDLTSDLTNRGYSPWSVDRALDKRLQRSPIAPERKLAIRKQARTDFVHLVEARHRRETPLGALGLVIVGMLVPAITTAPFGVKALSFFGWFLGMIPVGFLILLWTFFRDKSDPKP